MGFTFQINQDVEFNHNSTFLVEADRARPSLMTQLVSAKYLVTLNSASNKDIDPNKLIRQNIRQLTKQTFGKGQHFIIDFAQHYVGHFRINIASIGSPMDAPLYIHLRFAEIANELTDTSTGSDGWLSSSWIQEEYVHLDTLPATLELPRRYSFRFVEVTVIDTSPKWQACFSAPFVEAISSADDRRLPKAPQVDPMLQKIYQVSVRTLHECMQTVFEDGPKRDRRLWIGDLHLQALADYATYNQCDLVKRCLYLFAGLTAKDGRVPANVFTNGEPQPDDTFLFDYSLFFVSILSDYYAQTQDENTLGQLMPIAKQQIDLALEYVDHGGALILPKSWPVFVDWSDTFDKQTCAQMILIYALKQLIAFPNCPNLESYQSALIRLSNNVLKKRRDNGLFVSGTAAEVNIATQAWAVLAGVLPQEENQHLMQQAVKQLFPILGIVTPYMYHFIVQALFESNMQVEAIDLMKQYWGKMVELGADTFWEIFDPNEPSYSPYGNTLISSYCHAWGCTPAYLMTTYC